MHASVEKRLAALEQKTAPEEMVVWVSFVRPGPDGGRGVRIEPVGVSSGEWRIAREPGEPLEDFEARAKVAAPRNELGVKVLRDLVEA